MQSKRNEELEELEYYRKRAEIYLNFIAVKTGADVSSYDSKLIEANNIEQVDQILTSIHNLSKQDQHKHNFSDDDRKQIRQLLSRSVLIGDRDKDITLTTFISALQKLCPNININLLFTGDNGSGKDAARQNILFDEVDKYQYVRSGGERHTDHGTTTIYGRDVNYNLEMILKSFFVKVEDVRNGKQFKNKDAIIIFFDASDPESFKHVKEVSLVNVDMFSNNVVKVLVCNNVDSIKNDNWPVNPQEIRRLANDNGMILSFASTNDPNCKLVSDCNSKYDGVGNYMKAAMEEVIERKIKTHPTYRMNALKVKLKKDLIVGDALADLSSKVKKNKNNNNDNNKCFEIHGFDLDGTLTCMEGRSTIGSPSYKTVIETDHFKRSMAELKDNNKNSHKPYEVMCDEKLSKEQIKERSGQILAKMKEQEDKTLFTMSEKTKNYLKRILADDNCKVVIISKNLEEYIMAFLKINGFSDEELMKLRIIDFRIMKSLKGGDKSAAMCDFIENSLPKEFLAKVKCVKGYDDDRAQLGQIIEGAQNALGTNDKDISYIAFNGKNGCIDFDDPIRSSPLCVEFREVLEDIHEKLGKVDKKDGLIDLYEQLLSYRKRLDKEIKKVSENEFITDDQIQILISAANLINNGVKSLFVVAQERYPILADKIITLKINEASKPGILLLCNREAQIRKIEKFLSSCPKEVNQKGNVQIIIEEILNNKNLSSYEKILALCQIQPPKENFFGLLGSGTTVYDKALISIIKDIKRGLDTVSDDNRVYESRDTQLLLKKITGDGNKSLSNNKV